MKEGTDALNALKETVMVEVPSVVVVVVAAVLMFNAPETL